MSEAVLRRQDPPSPTTKVSKWLGGGARKGSGYKRSENLPTSATANLNKLRNRLLAIANEGSFSSNGSERIAAPNTGNSASSNTSEPYHKALRSSKEAWRISAQSSEKDDENITAATTATKTTRTATSTEAPLASSRPQDVSKNLPPRSPPRLRSSTRFNLQQSPRTPSRTPPANSSSHSTPQQSPSRWMDEQLGVLDRLSKQLSITASQLSDSPEKQRAVSQQQRARRSSVADWQKYQDLAAQLEEAKSQLENLESSDDEVSFAALLEDN